MKILVVDDEKNIRESIVRYLKLEKIEALSAENGLSAKRMLEEDSFDAAVIDLKMPGMNGLELLAWIKEQGPSIPVIMISAFGEINDAVEAMKKGAKDYLVKPFDPEELMIRIKRLVMEKVNQDRVNLGMSDSNPKLELYDNSSLSKKLMHLINKVAPTDSTVLITGESGTGKEVTARLIHSKSLRADRAFVPINIGGMPENLLESELFGYEKGAFTSANTQKKGIVEMASRGTLFLDEIGDMPLSLQVKLLRFLQDKKIQRLGGTQSIPIDLRIIAATNKNLKKLIEQNLFREDLYFRLNIISIELPPLREKIEEIDQLTGIFIKKFNKTMGRSITGITQKALKKLKDYHYPGNIRELENIIERAFILADTNEISEGDIDLSSDNKRKITITGTLAELEKETILQALNRWEGNRTKAAEELGITRRTLFNKIKEYHLDPEP
ncbi:MAG: sigma-54-dependent Fis family transcriptional regulator [Spirochaetales bacterium]|nr:sigma-54-dependent Fis family transcriptional regulator [Spirochaetales bacterium]